MVDKQYADTMFISKPFQPANDLIVAGIAVSFSPCFSDFLHCIDNDQLRVTVLPQKELELTVQAIPNLICRCGKVKLGCILYSVHHKHSALDALEIIFQC